MNDSDWKTYQENRLRHAEEYLNKSVAALDKVHQALGPETLHDLRYFQLLLQYRLDAQDVLTLLMQLEHSALQILGISPLHSPAVNIERLRFALGGGELHYLFGILNRLISELLHTIRQLQQKLKKDHALKLPKIIVPVKEERIKKPERHLEEAVAFQKSFYFILKKITESVEAIEASPRPGPVHDYIMALTGPISRFYQAISHGLTIGMDLYEQLRQKEQLDFMVDQLIQAPNQQLTPELSPLPTLFIQPKPELDPSRLEERAAARRTLNLFNR